MGPHYKYCDFIFVLLSFSSRFVFFKSDNKDECTKASYEKKKNLDMKAKIKIVNDYDKRGLQREK